MSNLYIEQQVARKSLSVDELARRNGICRATIYNEIARGNLKTIKVGRRRLITAEQEADWLCKCEASAQ